MEKIIFFTNSKIFLKKNKYNTDWALGFMMPGKNTSCPGFSKNSIGHLGFTGTSFWFDPEKDLIVNILSNRIYYKNSKTK